MKRIMKRGEEKTSKQWMIFVSLVSVLIASGLYSGVNQAIFHTDSFILQTIITLLLAYTFVFAFLFIKGNKK